MKIQNTNQRFYYSIFTSAAKNINYWRLRGKSLAGEIKRWVN